LKLVLLNAGIIPTLAAPLVTCEPAIAEACYLLRNLPGAAEAVLENVAAGIFQIPSSFRTPHPASSAHSGSTATVKSISPTHASSTSPPNSARPRS
jgi:hypothetical protein